jgi:hypothetical protein
LSSGKESFVVNIEPTRVIEALKQRVTALTMDNALLSAAVEQLTAEKEELELRLKSEEPGEPGTGTPPRKSSNGRPPVPVPQGGAGQ